MEESIVLTASSLQELEEMINENLEKGYLISGSTYPEDDEKISQTMSKAKNIEMEMARTAYLPLGFVVVFAIGTAALMM